MRGGGEAAHVGADLGDDDLRGQVTDAGDGPQQPHRLTERVEVAVHLREETDARQRGWPATPPPTGAHVMDTASSMDQILAASVSSVNGFPITAMPGARHSAKAVPA